MKKSNLVFNILFYILLIILISVLLLPYIYADRKLLHLPFALNLNHRKIILVKGEKVKLRVNGINKRVSFKSTDFKVAEVKYNGWVKANRAGKAVIKAKVDNKTLKCVVKVIEINKSKLELKVGDKYRLKIKGTFLGISWSSSNTNIVSVNKLGKITAKSKGKVTVTAKIKGKVLKCNIEVFP